MEAETAGRKNWTMMRAKAVVKYVVRFIMSQQTG